MKTTFSSPPNSSSMSVRSPGSASRYAMFMVASVYTSVCCTIHGPESRCLGASDYSHRDIVRGVADCRHSGRLTYHGRRTVR